MGFCIFNNVAVAAQLANKKYGANKVSFGYRSIAANDLISGCILREFLHALTSSNGMSQYFPGVDSGLGRAPWQWHAEHVPSGIDSFYSLANTTRGT